MTAQQPHEPTCQDCTANCDHAGEFHPEKPACLLHPKAREYLNAGVIEELERKAAHAKEGQKSHDSFELEWMHERKAYEYTLSLLRGDVL